MSPELRGSLDGRGLRIGIVSARFNEFVTSRLLEGARAALVGHGVDEKDVTLVSVPGSFEIPVAAGKMARSGRYEAVICLGAVIKGETDHDCYVAGEASRGIARAGFESGIPVVFGVLTTATVEQAVERAGGSGGDFVEVARPDRKPGRQGPNRGNSGYNSGLVAIEMANLMRALDSI